MTIHSDWSRILHDECPEAFTQGPPKRDNNIGIIDGHLQLMRLNPHSGSWDNFVQFQFVKPLRMLLDSGCNRVVLCFDSYDHVPAYKNMTQSKRINKHVVPTFAEGQHLPRNIPDDPMPYLMNRNFKKKLIDMLCDKVPAALDLAHGQFLIVDYQQVIEYTGPSGGMPQPVPDMMPMGESDVKFTRYVLKYGNALVHAIDGDYLMIALLFYCTSARLCDTNRIHIYRQLASPIDSEPALVRKRKANDVGQPKKKTPMCWVNMQMLYCVIKTCMTQSASARFVTPERTSLSDQHLVRSAIFFMLLAGTDFSRPLPLLGPKRLWNYLPTVVNALVASTGDDSVAIDIMHNAVIGAMYSELFEKHVVRGTRASIELPNVLRQLMSSRLSVTTKERLPDLQQVICTIKNVQWVVHYWEALNDNVETPLHGENGYVSDPCSNNVIFEDLS